MAEIKQRERKKKQAEKIRVPPQKWQIGGEQLTKEEFDIGKGMLGMERGRGGVPTPKVKEIIEAERAKEPAGIQAKREEEAKGFLEEKGFFEEERPEEVTELDLPERRGFGKIPIVGPGMSALNQIRIGEATYITAKGLHPLIGLLDKFGVLKDRDPREIETLIQDPETLREMALMTIQKEVITEGTSLSEKIGAFVEAIPVVGNRARAWAGQLVEDPKQNVDTIVSDVTAAGTLAMNTREKVLTGKAGDPFKVYDMLDNLDKNLVKMEQRIRVLSFESAVLIADADQLNRIETAILDARIRIFDAKISTAAGMIAPASDANVFLTLQELKGEGRK